ncbi:hypothetical protein DRW48_14525 [Paracoccus suum]|uniref:Uncharacterized protein n=1 Tax=Paracoccus suum TaxID=2259340 RepID=A0A344PMX7_9RHOB|nr:hypothetical protein [Paracoccus suum]AXC50732.1 hypothetical protein DRW48_14525 [Paracoccus suum]
MKRFTDRRMVLMAAGTAAAAAVAGSVAAQTADIRGTVEYEGGIEIPKGQLVIYVEGPAPENARVPDNAARVESDGGAKKVEFSVPAVARTAAPAQEVVARLERADGWLLARGSATLTADAPVQIVLYTAMY